MKGKTWSLCTGYFGDRLYLSMRTTNSRADAGRLMRRLLGRRGKGGGHGTMAGGWMTSGDPENPQPDSLPHHVASRLAKMLKKNPDKLAPLQLEDLPE